MKNKSRRASAMFAVGIACYHYSLYESDRAERSVWSGLWAVSAHQPPKSYIAAHPAADEFDTRQLPDHVEADRKGEDVHGGHGDARQLSGDDEEHVLFVVRTRCAPHSLAP